MHHVSIHTVVVSNFLHPFKVQTHHHHHIFQNPKNPKIPKSQRRRNRIVLDDRSYGKRRVRSTFSYLPWDTVCCCYENHNKNAQNKTKIKGKWLKWLIDSQDFSGVMRQKIEKKEKKLIRLPTIPGKTSSYSSLPPLWFVPFFSGDQLQLWFEIRLVGFLYRAFKWMCFSIGPDCARELKFVFILCPCIADVTYLLTMNAIPHAYINTTLTKLFQFKNP